MILFDPSYRITWEIQMLRLAIGMMLSLCICTACVAIASMEYDAIEAGVKLPPRYDDLEARYAAFEDRVICNPHRYRCVIAD